MECREVREKLSAYIEGMVPAAERAFMEEHLRTCPGCKESLTDLISTIEAVKAIPEVEPPPWLTQKVMARVRAEAEAMEARKGIWEKLFHPLHVKLPLEAAGVIAIAVVIIYVFREIQPQMQFSKAPLEGMKSPAISEVQRPATAPRSMQKSEKTISDKSIEAKRALPSGQPAPGRQAETPASLPTPSPTPAPAPAPAERYKEVGATAGAGVKGELPRQAPSGKEGGQLAFDATKERDQLRPSVGAAKPEAEVLAKKPSQPPAAPERPAVQAPPSAEKENRALPYASLEAKKDESKLETLPAAPRQEQASMKRAEEKSARLSVSAAPRAKALGGKEEPGIRLTLIVKDVNAARSEVEKAVAEPGGRVIKTESLENKALLTVELSSNRLETLRNKLRTLGEVKEETVGSEARGDAIAVVRIEILGLGPK